MREKIAGAAGHEPADRHRRGYLRIASFRNGVVEELRKQAADLDEAGAKTLIIDVRRTAEGPLDNGIAAARLFVKSGTLAIKAGRDKPEPREPIAARAGDGAIDLPVTVLVTTGTSGAARAVRRGARRQQARRVDRRAHARPRRHSEAGQAARGPRAVAHLRALPHAEGQSDSGPRPRARRRRRRARRRVRRARARQGSDPRRGARAHEDCKVAA